MNKIIFWDFWILITLFALTQILHKYEQLMKIRNKKINFFFCIKRFKNIINLFCVYIIKKRIIDENYKKILLLINVYAYWRFEKLKRYFVELAAFVNIKVKMNKILNYDPLLNIQNSKKIQFKKRFKFTSNRFKIVTKQ